MRKAIAGLAFTLAMLPAAAQSLPQFEAASLKPTPLVEMSSMPMQARLLARPRMSGGPGTGDPGQFLCSNCSLDFLIGLAYEQPVQEIVFHNSMPTGNFDLVAKVPPETGQHQFNLMLRQLLLDRFQLATHFVPKNLPTLILTMGNTAPKLQPAAISADTRPSMDPFLTNCVYKLEAHGESMQQLAAAISLAVRSPVVDRTGLNGAYDFSLAWYPAESLTGAGRCSGPRTPAAHDLLDAVKRQLGLKVESRKMLRDSLVVDSSLPAPADN